MPLGQASVVRSGSDVTLVALASTVPLALATAGEAAAEGISAEVIYLRCLVPLDMAAVLASVRRTSRLVDRGRRGFRVPRRAGAAGSGGVRSSCRAPMCWRNRSFRPCRGC